MKRILITLAILVGSLVSAAPAANAYSDPPTVVWVHHKTQYRVLSDRIEKRACTVKKLYYPKAHFSRKVRHCGSWSTIMTFIYTW